MIRIILLSLICTTALAQSLPMDFKPERISRTSTISVHAPVEKAFPLFGPLLEMEWAAGWEPRIIFLDQPHVAEHMIFQTKSHYGEDYLWAVTVYAPENYTGNGPYLVY